MNYQTRIEKLRERFLRCESHEQFQAALAEGGSIVIHAVDAGILRICESLLPAMQATKNRHGSAEALQSNSFWNFAFLESRDPTFFMVRHTKDVSVLRERFASFCLELAELIESVPEDEDTIKYRKAIILWNEKPELSGAKIAKQFTGDDKKLWGAFVKAFKRFAKTHNIEMKKRKSGMRRKSN